MCACVFWCFTFSLVWVFIINLDRQNPCEERLFGVLNNFKYKGILRPSRLQTFGNRDLDVGYSLERFPNYVPWWACGSSWYASERAAGPGTEGKAARHVPPEQTASDDGLHLPESLVHRPGNSGEEPLPASGPAELTTSPSILLPFYCPPSALASRVVTERHTCTSKAE